MSPSVVVIALFKLERICPVEFNIREESFIWLKASSYNKSAALPGSTKTLCTSKPLMQRVRVQVHHNGAQGPYSGLLRERIWSCL